MANTVKYLSYEGLEYFWKDKLKPLIEENEEIVATALTNLDNRLKTHTHSYVASAGYVATAANAVTAGRALYSGSAGYSASAARATSAASAGYSASAARATYAASSSYAATAANTVTAGRSIYSASAGYSASAARATYAASSSYAATSANSVTAANSIYSGSAGYSASAAKATYAASAGYAATAAVASKVILSSIITASRSSYLITADGEGKSIGDIMTLADALVFKGVITSNNDLPTTHKTGWTYRVNATNTYAGQKCERGDLVICIADGTSANNADWTVAQTNIDGVVFGPASSVSGNIAAFNSTNGKTIYDTGLKLSNVATSGHSHSNASQSAAGFMSISDKKKLDGIATGANAYTHPSTHPASIITGTLSVSNGGTGLSSLPEGHIILGTNTTTATSIKFVSISTAQINTIFGS